MGHRWNGDNPFSTSKCYYEEWFKTLAKFITNPLQFEPHHYKYSMDTYVELSVKKGTRPRRGEKPDTRTFISNLQQVML